MHFKSMWEHRIKKIGDGHDDYDDDDGGDGDGDGNGDGDGKREDRENKE